MSDRIHLSVTDARELSELSLHGMGFDDEQSRIIADHVIDAAVCGYEYSGLPKLLNLGDSPRAKLPKKPLSIVRETSVSALYDGGNNVGMYAMYRISEDAIRRASEHGFAIVGLTNSWTSGRGAYYVEMIARAGLVGMHFVSAGRHVAPMGGTKPTLGTNPMSFGYPLEGDPLVIDLGTSAFMATDLKMRERLGIALPEGVAIDADGNPTTDAALAKLGAILPFGGHKGHALSIAMRAFGSLCEPERDAEGIYGYVTIAFKPDLLMPLEAYRKALADAIAEIKATPRQPGVSEIRIPGERSFSERERLMREGIEIDRRIYDSLRGYARKKGSGSN
jgi:LDH2 family malate/lactate/ureidoglycolate dehydrogenase